MVIRFSIICGPRHRYDKGQTAAQAWNNYVEDAVAAESFGFDAFYMGEHHFSFTSGNSSPLTMAAAIAQRTTTLRVGTSVICAPFHNPIRLAEDIASVDIASNGRFDFGVGAGSQWEEFNTFGIDPKTRASRTWEVVDIVEKCLHGGEQDFSWRGKYYDFPEVHWILDTVQERIPIFWGGLGPQGVKRAAERGYHLIAPDVHGDYSRVLRENGRDPKDFYIGFVNNVGIADTPEEAIEGMVEPFAWVSNQYGQRKNLDGVKPDGPLVTEDDVRRSWKTGERVGFGVPLAGTPDQIIEALLPSVRGAQGVMTHIGIEVRQPGVSTEFAHGTMKKFSEEVMPVLRKEMEAQGF